MKAPFRQWSSEPGSGRTASSEASKHASSDGARDFEEGRPFFRQRGDSRDAFIAEVQTTWPVSLVCEVIQGSRSGFYAYAHRQAHRTVDRVELELWTRVKAIASGPRQSYGSRRMAKQRQRRGFQWVEPRLAA